MARIRTIKPEFWDDEKLAALPRDVRLLYIGMWNFSDDFGVIKANPIWLKSKVFPFDEIQLPQFKKWLEMLERPGFNSPGGSVAWAIPFSANGEAFYYLSNFSRHQRVDKPSTFNRNPEPPKGISDWKTAILDPIVEPSPSPPGALLSVLGRVEVKVEGEVKGKVKNVASLPSDPLFLNPDFLTAWEAWEQMRNSLKPKLTEHARALNFATLKKWAGDDLGLAIRIVNKSIEQGWKGFFPLKEDFNGTQKQATGYESTAQRNGRKFAEQLGKIAAGNSPSRNHEVLPLLSQGNAGSGNYGG